MRRRLVLAVAVFVCALAGAPSALAASDLFVSEYIEGSSNNKALEIFNDTGAAVDLAAGGYTVQMHFNGNTGAGLADSASREPLRTVTSMCSPSRRRAR